MYRYTNTVLIYVGQGWLKTPRISLTYIMQCEKPDTINFHETFKVKLSVKHNIKSSISPTMSAQCSATECHTCLRKMIWNKFWFNPSITVVVDNSGESLTQQPSHADWSATMAEEERQEGYYTDSMVNPRPRRRGWVRGRGRMSLSGSRELGTFHQQSAWTCSVIHKPFSVCWSACELICVLLLAIVFAATAFLVQ